jgi:hypothetical protein
MFILVNLTSQMKRLLSVLVFAVILATAVYGQRIDDSLRYAESIWSMEKKAMILKEMNLTEAEKSAFWPVYESYANAIQYLDMEYLRLLEYSTDDLSEKESAALCEHLLLNDLLLAKTRKQYFKKFKKAISPAQAGKFMQLDDSFRTMLRLRTQKQAPAILTSINRIHIQN